MKIGQRVKGIRFSKDDKYNPKDCEGVVVPFAIVIWIFNLIFN